jgi:uncharacterized protein (DUF433 family)
MALRKRDQEEVAAITCTPRVMGGSPCIAGHRIRVADAVQQARLHNQLEPAEAVLPVWPYLTREQADVAFEYYAKHKNEIDQYIEEEEEIYQKALDEKRNPFRRERESYASRLAARRRL